MLSQRRDTNRNWLIRRTHNRDTEGLKTDGAEAQWVDGIMERERKDQRRVGRERGTHEIVLTRDEFCGRQLPSTVSLSFMGCR